MVWYRWRAPRTGFLRLRTTDNTFDTVLAVYRGSRLDTLRLVDANDDSGPDGASEVRIEVQRGQTYGIAVGGFGAGDFVPRWWFWRTTQPNDDFADAATIVGRNGHVRGSNFPATRETGEPVLGASVGSVWYRWRAPRFGVLRLRTTDVTFDTVLAVYRGARLTALDLLAADDDSGRGVASEVRIPGQRGRAHRFVVAGFGMGDLTLRWSVSATGGMRR